MRIGHRYTPSPRRLVCDRAPALVSLAPTVARPLADPTRQPPLWRPYSPYARSSRSSADHRSPMPTPSTTTPLPTITESYP